MDADEALKGVRRLFLDTAPVIYYVEGNARYLPVTEFVFERLDGGHLQAVTSPVTLSECLVVPYRLKDERLRDLFARLIVQQMV